MVSLTRISIKPDKHQLSHAHSVPPETHRGGTPQLVLGADFVAQVEQEAVGVVGAEEEADVGGGGRPVQALWVLQTQRHVAAELDTHADAGRRDGARG